jgi:hypothetical protein
MFILFKKRTKQVFHHLKATIYYIILYYIILYYIDMIRPLHILRDLYYMIKNQAATKSTGQLN